MAAGLSRKQFNSRVYNRLKSIQHKLIRAGVPAKYERYQLFPDLTANGRDFDFIAFNISYRRLDASNGETAGLPTVRVQIEDGTIEKYGNAEGTNHGTFEQGIQRIIEAFNERSSKDTTSQGQIA